MIALARADAEVSRIVTAADAGWAVSDRAGVAAAFDALRNDDRRQRTGQASAAYARTHFSIEHFAQSVEQAIFAGLDRRPRARPRRCARTDHLDTDLSIRPRERGVALGAYDADLLEHCRTVVSPAAFSVLHQRQ